MPHRPRIAYLVNQYPRTSHSFIRREILALEQQDVCVLRFAIRGAPEPLTNPADIREQEVTTRLLDSPLALLVATLLTLFGSPLSFFRAVRVAADLARSARAQRLRHVAYLAEACLLLRHLRLAGATHLHAHFGTNPAAVALLVRVLGGPHYSFTVHGPEEFDRPEAIGLPRKIESAAFVVAVSHFGVSQLMRWSRPVDWPKLAKVRCGVDARWFEDASPPSAESRRFLSVGRLSGQKGQHLLVAAAALLARTHQFELRIIGDGELRESLVSEIERLNIGESVRLLGWADENTIVSELDQARAFVLPSFAEGLPVVLMESMARMRPAIATYIAGIPELVTSDSGWLVPAGSAEELASAMARVLDASPADLAARGIEGQARVRKMHSVEDNARSLLELVRGVAWHEGGRAAALLAREEVTHA